MKRKIKKAAVMIAASLTVAGMAVWGCSAEKPADAVQLQSERGMSGEGESVSADVYKTLSEGEETAADEPAFSGVPELPAAGERLSDFIPPDWRLLDSVILEYNGDGIDDYVGVLEYDLNRVTDGEGVHGEQVPCCNRILFAASSQGTEQYRLDFQDENLIRTRWEGGVAGNPYRPLTAEGRSFTTHSFGGSGWKWSEAYTYTYNDGNWYLTASETTYGYGPYITSRSVNDYEKGDGVRNRRSDEWEDMNKNSDGDGEPIEESYDLSYEVALDAPVTIDQAGMRCSRAPDRVAGWPVDSVKAAEGIDISRELMDTLHENLQPRFIYDNDENYLLCIFRDSSREKYYLAQYDRKDRTLTVLVQEDAEISEAALYRERIYYSAKLMETVSCRDYEGKTAQSKEQTGMTLYSIRKDGADRREVFTYRSAESGDGVMESRPPYLTFITEINGGEIVVEVYIGGQPHPFYRMDLDGGGVSLIGTVPKES